MLKQKKRLLAALALLMAVTVPMTAGAKDGELYVAPFLGGYTFDGAQFLKTAPVYGLRLGYGLSDRLGVEAVGGTLSTEWDHGKGENFQVTHYGLDLVYDLTAGGKLVPFVGGGFGGITFAQHEGPTQAKDAYTKGVFNYGLGLKYLVGPGALRLDVRHLILSSTTPYSNLEYTLGYVLPLGGQPAAAPAPADRDGDGVIDALDRCPGTMAGMAVGADGCPPVQAAPAMVAPAPAAAAVAPADSDGDGVFDDQDRCPGTPAGTKVDAAGCPLDSDGDGVVDSQDRCPGTPAGTRVDVAGCPPPVDSDGDGVADGQDRCPGTPAGTPVDAAGCPLDSDGDGIVDEKDQCPGTRAGLVVDNKGCPPPIEEQLKIVLNVKFASGKADIDPKYVEDLKKVGDFMTTYPGTTTVIEGHTDSQGAAAANKKLSQRRADNVRKYLIDKYSIAPARITAIGYGAEKPIADNATAEGRQQNRRIEAAIETTVKKPQQ